MDNVELYKLNNWFKKILNIFLNFYEITCFESYNIITDVKIYI